MSDPRTIAQVVSELFPDKRVLDFEKPSGFPLLPFDLFAATGVLLELSGAYQHVSACATGRSAAPHVDPVAIPVTVQDVKLITRLGRQWLDDGPGHPPAEVKVWWNQLRRKRHKTPVFQYVGHGSKAPAWWRPALLLFLVADEAGEDVEGGGSSFFEEYYQAAASGSGHGVDATRRVLAPPSLSAADPDVVCVGPKRQTPSVGCTMRALSRNLALLPPRGEAATRWIYPRALGLENSRSAGGDDPLNILLVPLPYEVSATAFRTSKGSQDPERWRWFDLDQAWLSGCATRENAQDPHSRPKLVAFVDSLLKEARKDVGAIGGVVFPELALDWKLFRSVANFLNEQKDVEFFVSGSSTRPLDEVGAETVKGNFASTALLGLSPENSDKKFWVHSDRPKHHRWKLTESQISEYGLGASLDPSVDWWEHIDIPDRCLDMFTLRGKWIITTLICEDLARAEPCLGVLRSTGPSLVIALLMDGPQMMARWPGRYATILADDPGSSVLTFTSKALLHRQNGIRHHNHSTLIALWKDEIRGYRELKLPDEDDALCITLSPGAPKDRTLDGRVHPRSSWQLSGVRSLRSSTGRP